MPSKQTAAVLAPAKKTAAAKKAAPAKKTAAPKVVPERNFIQKTDLVIPDSLAKAADMLYAKRAERLDLQRRAKALEDEEKDLKEFFINTLPKGESSGVAGLKARVAIIPKSIPTVEDWAKLHAHIKRTGNFEFLARSLAKAAVEERWADGKTVPGVGKFNYLDVSVTKV